MENASVVFEHNFDNALLEQFEQLRTIRLSQMEKMLADLKATAEELTRRDLLTVEESSDRDELRVALEQRIFVLRERLKQPDVIYADEISFYVDLLKDEE